MTVFASSLDAISAANDGVSAALSTFFGLPRMLSIVSYCLTDNSSEFERDVIRRLCRPGCHILSKVSDVRFLNGIIAIEIFPPADLSLPGESGPEILLYSNNAIKAPVRISTPVSNFRIDEAEGFSEICSAPVLKIPTGALTDSCCSFSTSDSLVILVIY